jgi:hypothetical protein
VGILKLGPSILQFVAAGSEIRLCSLVLFNELINVCATTLNLLQKIGLLSFKDVHYVLERILVCKQVLLLQSALCKDAFLQIQIQ